MVGVPIQTMPMLLFWVHRHWGGWGVYQLSLLFGFSGGGEHFTRATARREPGRVTLPFPCLFPWTCRDCFPVSPLPLCQMCFQLLGGCKGVGQNSQAAPLEVKPKPPCCTFASSATGTFQFFPGGFLVTPRIPKPLEMWEENWGWFCLTDITCVRTDVLGNR